MFDATLRSSSGAREAIRARPRTLRAIAFVAFAVAAFALVASRPAVVGLAAQGPPHVVLVSIDGLMPGLYGPGSPVNLPTLRRLAREGASARGVVGVLPSVTYPSHTTLVTGVRPAVHGIYDNRILDPEGTSAGAWYWYARQIRVPTLAGAARSRGLVAASVNWPVTVGLDADFLFPEFWRSNHPEGRWLLDALSTPHLLDAVEIDRGRPLAWPLTDDERVEIAAYLVRRHRPGFLQLHLVEVDGAQHANGPGSKESIASVVAADGRVARLLQALDEAGLRDRTVFAVVSDHGFLPLGRQLQPNALFRQEGLLETDDRGRITSWRAYFHSSGGSGFVYLARPDDNALREKVGALLEKIKADPENGVMNLWTAADLARAGAHPDAAFGLDMRPGFYTGSGTDALVVPSASKGGHGFAPDRPELHASLILVGPGIPAGRDLGIVRMTQIAPTLARVLGVGLSPQADSPLGF
jgi:predicted AlkP superfamily pyrophosphatase or phosphodiesterase